MSDSIVAIGDSITAGSGLTSPATQTYPALLAARAAAAGHPVVLANRAVPGTHTTEGRMNLPLTLSPPPKVLLIMYGSNDVQWRGYLDPATGAYPASTEHIVNREYYASNLVSIVEVAKGVGARPILITPPMRSSVSLDVPNYSWNEATGAWVEVMRQVAASYDAPIVDIFRDWAVRRARSGRLDGIDALLVDTLHPNASGHQAIADLAWPAFWGELTR